MRITAYLVFNRRGTTRTTKHPPEMVNGEYAIRLKLECPDSVFRPEIPDVTVEIGERELIKPTVTVEPPAEAIRLEG